MTLPPYSHYVDSGVEWFGEIPSHWDLQPINSILSERNEVNKDGQETIVLSVLKNIGVIPYDEKGKIGNKKSDDTTRYKIVREGDIVLNSMNVIIGSVGVSKYNGCLSPVYYVLRTHSDYVSNVYIGKVFQIKDFQQSLIRIGNGILAHRMRIPMSKLKLELIPIPPRDEQTAIVNFLDVADKQIQYYIRAKQKLISVLNEQKQAIIQQAVTRGLNPDAPMKESGIEWLGEIPSHWNLASLGVLTFNRCDGPFGSGLKSNHYTNSGIRVVRLQNIGHAEFMDNSKVYISHEHYSTLGNHDVIGNDLLIAGLGDINNPAGRACVAPMGIEPAMVKADCFRFRLNTTILEPLFIAFQLSVKAHVFSSMFSTGATRQRLNLTVMASRMIVFPSLEEQEFILSYVFSKLADLNKLIELSQNDIQLIREYRTRLITDVVTGKLDVRGAVFDMPTEFDETDLPDVAEDELFNDDEDDDLLDDLGEINHDENGYE